MVGRTGNVDISESAVDALRRQVDGSVLIPGHPGYDMTRRGWNLAVEQHPAVIIVATSADDAAAGIRFAREHGLGVAVQSTGHGIVHAADDAVLIVMSEQNEVFIDPERQVAHVEAGAIWKQVLDAGQEHGLAPLLGSSPYVGIVGYTMGGGMGWLARKYGYAADSVRAIMMVTPDGELRYASATQNADLFWGVRGGGSNFGVVTGLEFALYPVSEVYGGELMYPIERYADALRFFRDWVADLPDEMTSSITMMHFPPLPQLPEFLRGKKFVQVKAAYVGSSEQGEAYIQEWLDWATPIHNTFRVMPFSEVGSISNDPVDPMPSHVANELFNELSDDVIDIIARYNTDDRAPWVFTGIRHMGGAMQRADRSANAIGNRDAQFVMEIVSALPSPDALQPLVDYIAEFKSELYPYTSGGNYLNFMAPDEANLRTRDAYMPGTYERLVALKAKYDPDNLFRYSFSIPVSESQTRRDSTQEMFAV